MNGDALPRRGEVWWVRADKRRPAVVVQTDKMRDARVRLSRGSADELHLEGLPGHVRLDRRETRLSKPSVANVYDVQKVLRPISSNGWRHSPPSGCRRSVPACAWCSTPTE